MVITRRARAVLVTNMTTLVTVGTATTVLIEVGPLLEDSGTVTNPITAAVAIDTEPVRTTRHVVAWVRAESDVDTEVTTRRSTVSRLHFPPVTVTRRQDVGRHVVVLVFPHVAVDIDCL